MPNMNVQPDVLFDRGLFFLGHIVVGLVNILIIFVLTSVEFVKIDFRSILYQSIDSLTSLELNIQLLTLIVISSYILGLVIFNVYSLLSNYTLKKFNSWTRGIGKKNENVIPGYVAKKVKDYFKPSNESSDYLILIIQEFTTRNNLIRHRVHTFHRHLYGGFALSLVIYSIVVLFTISNNDLILKFVLFIALLFTSFFFHFLAIKLIHSLILENYFSAYSYITENEKKES